MSVSGRPRQTGCIQRTLIGVGLKLQIAQTKMVEQTRDAEAGAELTLGYVVVGTQILLGCHGERAEYCSGWSWQEEQDDHMVRRMHPE